MKLRLLLDRNGLECQHGHVICPIWIEVDDYAFPSKGWDDFPLVLLNWWIDSASSGDRAMIFHFMDGPYRYNIVSSPEGLVAIFFEGDREVRRSSLDMTLNELLIELKEQASWIINILAEEYPEPGANPDLLHLTKKIS